MTERGLIFEPDISPTTAGIDGILKFKYVITITITSYEERLKKHWCISLPLWLKFWGLGFHLFASCREVDDIHKIGWIPWTVLRSSWKLRLYNLPTGHHNTQICHQHKAPSDWKKGELIKFEGWITPSKTLRMLSIISRSFWEYLGFYPEKCTRFFRVIFPSILFSNKVVISYIVIFPPSMSRFFGVFSPKFSV